MVNDLRSILPVAQGKQGQPSAVILDGRTLQSTCESGLRAGYDGYKRKKGSKVHMTVDTPGHLPAVQVTPADEQERAQVRSLAQDVRHVTGQTVKLAFVDQGYTGQGRVAQRQDVLFEGFAEVAYTDWALRPRQRTPQTAISSPGNKKTPGKALAFPGVTQVSVAFSKRDGRRCTTSRGTATEREVVLLHRVPGVGTQALRSIGGPIVDGHFHGDM